MDRNIKNFDQFKDELMSDPELQNQFKTDPVKAIQQFQQGAKETDRWIYRIVVLALGITVLAIILGVVILMLNGKITGDNNVPAIFTAIGSAAIGALAGLLAPSPRNN